MAPETGFLRESMGQAGGRRQEVEGRTKYFRKKTRFLWLGT